MILDTKWIEVDGKDVQITLSFDGKDCSLGTEKDLIFFNKKELGMFITTLEEIYERMKEQ